MLRFTLVLVCSVLSAAALADEPVFRRHVINDESTFSACAVFDVNNDGRLDIVSGGWWYAAPAWEKHFLRDVEEIRGRFDDYSNLPLDVNGDGNTDLISVNYRSESIYWVEHPRSGLNAGTAWERKVAATPGAMETGRLVDIDDDGRLDVLPNGTKFAAWWDIEPGETPKWIRHELPLELAGHGVGFGDINGDGRGDIVGPHGWAEAPQNPRNERWQFHPEFELWQDASVPILVQDVDGDGDNDLVWGRGHRFGLYWMEQSQGVDGGREWVRHAIDTSWSQAHSLLWADLNGDGRAELIAGSRFMGHDGKDPGEYNPQIVCSYQFLPESRTWNRQTIWSGDSVGFGLDPKVADLDADGDLDLVCPGRSGLYVLENLRVFPTGSESRQSAFTLHAADYDHENVMVLWDGVDNFQPIATPLQMGLRRQKILAGMSTAMGELPTPDRRVPLDIQIISTEAADGYVRQKISFAVEPGDRVPAWLLIPAEQKPKGPAMLCLHQTTGIGKDEPAGLGGLENLHYAHELAKQGFVCLVPDYPSFGEYPYDYKVQGKHYASGSMKAIWNNIRAIDVLESLSVVDPNRIGCIGHSLGGHNALFTAAFDGRIRAVVTSCGFTAFHDYYKGNLAGWTSDRYMPRIRDIYENNPNKIPFDFQEVLAAIVPRSIFINAPTGDDNFDNSGVRKVVAEVSKAFEVYGSGHGELTSRYPECAHDFPDDVRVEAYEWLKRELK
ncbi:MAG: FG-GAP-like repeat-containing protein [Planctomycetota bacterium]|nr:FG-GAP-like repeat-containing protein [Planctomycetota bacterium]